MATDGDNIPKATFNLLGDCLVGTLQVDLDIDILEQFKTDLLCRLQETQVPWLVIDCSETAVLDVEDFVGLRRVVAMAGLVGTKAVIAGLRPGVVAALVQRGAESDGLETAPDLPSALAQVRGQRDGLNPVRPPGAERAGSAVKRREAAAEDGFRGFVAGDAGDQ